jgi:hypothetical protein
MKRIFALSLLLSASLLPIRAAQAAPFEVTLSSNGQTRSYSYSNIEDAIDAISGSSLEELLPSYTDGSPTFADVNLRGLDATLSYPGAGTTLVLEIPSIGLRREFTGATRDDSQEELEDFFRGQEGDEVLTRILQELAAETPIDPVAGNPNALLSRMGDHDFARATSYREGLQISAVDRSDHMFGAELEGGWYGTDVVDQDVYSADLNYSYSFDDQLALILDLPLTYIESEDAKAYQASLGAGLRMNVTPQWAITPIIRVGGSASEDLGSAAIIYSGSVTSDYRIPVSDRDQLQIGNMVGYYKTDGITVADYRIDYDLSNVRFKNGVALAHEFTDDLVPITGRVFANDSRFAGDDLFNDNYQEYGVSVGRQLGQFSSVDLGASYLYAEDYDGVKVNFNLRF